MAIMIKVPTIKTGWESLVKRIMKNGVEIRDERGSVTKELLNTIVNIKNPMNTEAPEGYFWTGEKLDKYSEQFLSSDKQGFIYTYGNRLRAHFNGIDQIQEAIKRLNNFIGDVFVQKVHLISVNQFDPRHPCSIYFCYDS